MVSKRFKREQKLKYEELRHRKVHMWVKYGSTVMVALITAGGAYLSAPAISHTGNQTTNCQKLYSDATNQAKRVGNRYIESPKSDKQAASCDLADYMRKAGFDIIK